MPSMRGLVEYWVLGGDSVMYGLAEFPAVLYGQHELCNVHAGVCSYCQHRLLLIFVIPPLVLVCTQHGVKNVCVCKYIIIPSSAT